MPFLTLFSAGISCSSQDLQLFADEVVQDCLKMIGITAAAEQKYRRGSFCALYLGQN